MDKKKLNTFVSITQILSSLAVFISIIYLVTEYNRTSVLNEKYIENIVYDRMMELDRLVIENPDLAALKVKVSISPDSLSESEKLRYLAFEHIFYDSWETLWVGYKDGLVERKTWDDWHVWFMNEAKNKPLFALEGNIHHFSSEFLAFVRSDLNPN